MPLQMDLIGDIIANLNLVEVRGQQNLALLYNSIDHLKKLQDLLSKEVTTTEEVPVNAKDNTVK